MISNDFNVDDLLDSEFIQNIVNGGDKIDLSEKKERKCELANLTADNIEDTLLAGVENTLSQVDDAIEDVILQVRSTPNDGEVIEGLAKLIQARSNVISSAEKIYLSREKFKQQLILTKLKLDNQYTMNRENNETTVTLTREEVMANIMANVKNVTKKSDEEIIDADIVED